MADRRAASEGERREDLTGIGTTSGGSTRREGSHDGYELRFAVNYLAGYLLTRLLLPHLRASAPARIVNVASAGQAPIDFSDVMLERDYDGVRAYGERTPRPRRTSGPTRCGLLRPATSVNDHGANADSPK